jgi:hypothetical protein
MSWLVPFAGLECGTGDAYARIANKSMYWAARSTVKVVNNLQRFPEPRIVRLQARDFVMLNPIALRMLFHASHAAVTFHVKASHVPPFALLAGQLAV